MEAASGWEASSRGGREEMLTLVPTTVEELPTRAEGQAAPEAEDLKVSTLPSVVDKARGQLEEKG